MSLQIEALEAEFGAEMGKVLAQRKCLTVCQETLLKKRGESNMTQDYDVEYTVTASDLKLYTEHFLEIAEILRRHGYQSSPLEITFSRDELQIMAEGLQDLCYQGDVSSPPDQRGARGNSQGISRHSTRRSDSRASGTSALRLSGTMSMEMTQTNDQKKSR